GIEGAADERRRGPEGRELQEFAALHGFPPVFSYRDGASEKRSPSRRVGRAAIAVHLVPKCQSIQRRGDAAAGRFQIASGREAPAFSPVMTMTGEGGRCDLAEHVL